MGACLSSAVPDPPPATSFYHLHALDIDKHDLAFTELNDKVCAAGSEGASGGAAAASFAVLPPLPLQLPLCRSYSYATLPASEEATATCT